MQRPRSGVVGAEGRRRAGTAAALAAGALASGCAGGPAAGAPSAAVSSTTQVTIPLVVTVAGPPSRSFVLRLEHWKVCDQGTVTNPADVVAHDVRVIVRYLDHGAVIGGTGVAEAPADGGALGDLPPHASRSFQVCGFAANEPDEDVVTAVVGTAGP